MHASQAPLHYAPASVGALMDPEFLRGAVSDADGRHPSTVSSWPRMPAWLRAAAQIVASTSARYRRR